MSINRRSFIAGLAAASIALPVSATVIRPHKSSTDELVDRLTRKKKIENETLYLDKPLEMPKGTLICNCIIKKKGDFKGSCMITIPSGSTITNCIVDI